MGLPCSLLLENYRQWSCCKSGAQRKKRLSATQAYVIFYKAYILNTRYISRKIGNCSKEQTFMYSYTSFSGLEIQWIRQYESCLHSEISIWNWMQISSNIPIVIGPYPLKQKIRVTYPIAKSIGVDFASLLFMTQNLKSKIWNKKKTHIQRYILRDLSWEIIEKWTHIPFIFT